jgi:para-aminobenzoate synthetase component 1
MTELPIVLSLECLSSLQANPIVIRAIPEGWIAYLDFTDTFELVSHNTESGISRLTESPDTRTSLSFNGWVGFFGYEFLAAHFGLHLQAKRDLEIADGWFGRPSTLVHLGTTCTRVESTDPVRESEIGKILSSAPIQSLPSFHASERTCNLDFAQYKPIFEQAREAILDGETYQIKISQRFEAKAQIDPLLAFAKLSKTNPAPEAFLLQTPRFSIISCSPEVVIDQSGDTISTRPIGGTYARSSSCSDKSVVERFLGDSKEVSEHNMLVDLERNDLSSLCIPGTVQLERFREVETYAHLHHLVSTIRGTLRQGTTLSEILQGMLPGGSITGCPKARTMEWIDRLEPCFRGPYTGSFGTIEDNGNLHLNLIIRSMLVLGEKCFTQAGGGIVVNSTPEYEYRENQIKAQALLDLLE